MNLPSDLILLLSLINTKLRDEYSSLASLCEEEDVEEEEIISRLAELGYHYDEKQNAFK